MPPKDIKAPDPLENSLFPPSDMSPRSWRESDQYSPSWQGPGTDSCPWGNLPCKHGPRSHFATENPGERTCYGCKLLWGETVVCRPPDAPRTPNPPRSANGTPTSTDFPFTSPSKQGAPNGGGQLYLSPPKK
ncbi:hypothetical protein FRB93_013663 [Tulasnella sp. JGI-2019a]|nr:hypothetical protein FRB93_013663 [Tulasnella sp. JGI-2019a]